MRQRFRRKELHPALRDAPVLAQPVSEKMQLPLRTKAMHQSLFPVDHVFRPRVALFRQQRGQHAALRGQWVHRVFHHGEFARGHCPQRAMTTRRNPDRVLNLFPGEAQRPPGNQGRNECRERGMMPSPLANARKRRFAQPHLEFVPQHQADN